MKKKIIVITNEDYLLDLFGQKLVAHFKKAIENELVAGVPYILALDRPTHSCAIEMFDLISVIRHRGTADIFCYEYTGGAS